MCHSRSRSDLRLNLSSAATSSWIQVNLNQIRKVTGIVIQGCPQSDSWITKFKLQHSMDGASWSNYINDGEVSDSRRSSSHLTSKRPEDRSSLNSPLYSSFSPDPRTETLPTLSCWARRCRQSTSASSRWRPAVKRAFALTSWAARQTVRTPRGHLATRELFQSDDHIPNSVVRQTPSPVRTSPTSPPPPIK